MFGTTKHHRTAYGGRDPRWWPLLLLLLTVVLLPTACLLWLMTKAIDNERLAVRQILAETCRGQLVRLRSQWDEHWQTRAQELDQAAAGKAAPAAFAAIVGQKLATSAVCYDDRDHATYPTPPVPPPADEPLDHAAWASAGELEHAAQKPLEAAKAYAAIARTASSANVAARALMAQARSIAQAGRRDEALQILTSTLAEERFRRAVDGEGRLIVADAELRALELIGNRSEARLQELAGRLATRLNDYSDPLLGSAQRRFLMQALEQLTAGTVSLPTLSGEQLAAAFLESGAGVTGRGVLRAAGVPGLWQFPSADGRVVTLFRTETLSGELLALAAHEGLAPGVNVELLPPDATAELSGFLHVLPPVLGSRAGNWPWLGTTKNSSTPRPTAKSPPTYSRACWPLRSPRRWPCGLP